MRVTDAQLEQARETGFVIVEDFVPQGVLERARAALWEVYPRPDDYFADASPHRAISASQFAGIRVFPYQSPALNELPVLPDLVDAAERFCGTPDVEIYKIELWAKYAGAINYDQAHHFDYGNHTLVVPKQADRHVQMTTFILLSDVTAQDGPTKVVPRAHTRDLPLVPQRQKMGAFFDKEVAVTGPAGSLFIYRTDVMHRGSDFAGPGRSRFAMLIDFQPRGWPWTGKMAWPDHALSPHWANAMTQMSPRQRTLFGFPAIGDPYWDAQTLRDVGLRYPAMDMAPYARASASSTV